MGEIQSLNTALKSGLSVRIRHGVESDAAALLRYLDKILADGTGMVTEPDEMVPLWKILHLAEADWTYGAKGWAAENYCMFLADDDNWKHIVSTKKKAVEDLGCKIWLNTE